MKLNPDCVRDVLLAVESADLDEHISPRTLHNSLPQYSESEIEYTCLILDEGGFIIAITMQLPGQEIAAVKSIVRLTYQGHELAAKIRDPERWPNLKKGLSAVRDYSLSALNAIAEGAASAGISTFVSTMIQTSLQ